MKERNYLFLGLSEEGWYKRCDSCGTEISAVCPHKKNRNWREELTVFLFLLLSLFCFLFLLSLPVAIPLYLSLLCTLLILKYPSKNLADVSTSYSAFSYAFTFYKGTHTNGEECLMPQSLGSSPLCRENKEDSTLWISFGMTSSIQLLLGSDASGSKLWARMKPETWACNS